MAIVFRSQSAVATGATTLTINRPSGVVDGDFLLMVLSHKGAGFATLPGGWTLVQQDVSSSIRGEVYWKRASGEPASYNVTGMADVTLGVILAYIGVLAAGDPIDASTVRANAAGVNGTLGLTTTVPNTLLLMTVSSNDNLSISPGQYTPADSFAETLRERVDTVSSIGTDAGIGVSEGFLLQAMTTGVTRYQTSPANVAVVLAVKPEPEAVASSATRFYATRRALPYLVLGPPSGPWEDGDGDRATRGAIHLRLRLAPSAQGGGGLATSTFSTEVGTPAQPILSFSWAIPNLAAQTFGGTINLCFKVAVGDVAPASAQYQLRVVVTQGQTATVRHVLLTDTVDPTLWSTTATWRQLAVPLNLAGLTCDAGDTLIVEVGASCSPFTPPTLSNIYTLGYGTSDPISEVPYADATPGSTGNGAAWVEFSQAVQFTADPASPSNLDCASALDIPSVPYTGAAQVTTEAASIGRAVWYRWVADRTGRMIASSLGGNVTTLVSVWEGTACGSRIRIDAAEEFAWIGTSQSISVFPAVLGQTYWFQITTGTSGIHAPESGGVVVLALTANAAPQTGDLYVDCQHLAVYRAGVLINATSSFYNLTPTGNAIDYTLRPLDSFNGGVDVSERIYVGLFGSNPLIEIIDLTTLNVDEFAVDFIDDPLNGSQNISTIVFNFAGTLVMGWYGDNYSVVGGLSSPGACQIRTLDATHADNQPGAPFPAASAFTIQQEVEGSDFVDLTVGNDIVFYTSAGWTIFRYSFASGQLSAYATLSPIAGPRPGLRGVKILPPGDGSAGVLVAAGTRVLWVTDSGVVRTYAPIPEERGQDLDKVEIDADGRTFWVSDQFSTSLFQFDLLSGVQLQELVTNLPAGQLCGFSIYRGYRAGNVLPPPPLTTTACPPVSWLQPAAAGCVAIGEL